MKTLIIVDLQNDFLPGGELAAPKGDKIIPVVNRIMKHFDLILASKDWHPRFSVHFDNWPVHCVKDSKGAAFPDKFDDSKVDRVLYKGTKNRDNGYSAFEATNVSLRKYLKEKGIKEIYICGLTTEYCIKETVLDALRSRLKTYVIQDGIEAVKPGTNDPKEAISEMKERGAVFIRSKDLK